MPANWQAGLPEFQKTRKPANQHAVKIALDSNLNDPSIIDYLQKEAQKKGFTPGEGESLRELEHPQRNKSPYHLSSRTLL